MNPENIGLLAHELIGELAVGNYDGLVRRCTSSRLTSDDLRTVIADYGRRLVSPPANAYQKIDAVRVANSAIPTWSVRIPVWTVEEGRSDLTLEFTVAFSDGHALVQLDDLHVL